MHLGFIGATMKKLLTALCVTFLLGACAAVQEAKNFANCKYAMQAVEITDYNVNSIDFDIYLSISNLNKKSAAAIKKFEGKLSMNDIYVADINFADVRIEPGATKIQKASVTVPMKNLSTKLVGLVGMGSVSVDYHIIGTAYFDTPLGEVPIPVDIGRRGSNN